MGVKTHFGDPCIHCGTQHDAVVPGPCSGDSAKAIPIAYRSLGVRHDGIEYFRIRWSDNRVTELWRHVSERAPYFHFGHSENLVQPPRYDPNLKADSTQ